MIAKSSSEPCPSDRVIFTKEQTRFAFQPSFWPQLSDDLEHESYSSAGRIYLSDPSVSSTEIYFPHNQLIEFLSRKDIQSCIDDIYSYRSKLGDLRVIDSIRDFHFARYGQRIKRGNVLQTIGATNAIDLAISVIMKSGDCILIPTPSYFIFHNAAYSRGFDYEILYCNEEHRFTPTKEGIEQNILPNTRVVGIVQPVFPTGHRIDEIELIKIIDFLAAKGIFIVLDMVYDLLTFDNGKVICTDSNLGTCFERNSEFLMQINSFSKTWSAPGLRFGYLMASEEIIKKAAVRLVSTVGRCPVILAPLYSSLMRGTTQMVANADSAFRSILTRNMKEYQNRVSELASLVSGSGLEILESDAGFNVFVKLTNVPNDPEKQWEFAERLYNDLKVMIDYGSLFGVPHHPNVPTYIRVNLGIAKDRLLAGISRLASFHLGYRP